MFYFLVTLRTKCVQVVEAQSYSILFQGLPAGRHEFRFEVGKALFEEYPDSEIRDGKCRVEVVLDRGEAHMTLQVHISGEVIVPCDRCLEDCSIPIEFEGSLPVRFSDEEHEWDGEVMWLLPGENSIDLTQYIYESIVLAIPYQRVHPDGACDPDMLRRFRIVSQDEFASIEGGAEQPTVHSGGDWDKLAALREQMERDADREKNAGPAADKK